MKLTPLIEDLERLQFKLLVESQLLDVSDDIAAKRLADMADETADAIERVRSLVEDPQPTRAAF